MKDLTSAEREEARLERQTDEGAQQLQPQRRVREIVLTGGGMWPEDDADDTMIINMGPQHPSTHGVLRLMMELDSEEVVRIKPVIGYLHTGMEKTGEELTYVQGGTNVTRMDYAAPLSNELVYSMAVERLLDIEVPPRATWIRMMLVELNRMSSHLLFQATNGMDIGAVSMMLYGWREREEVLRYLEFVTGLRMNHNFIRPGGVAADLPDGWQERVLELCDTVEHGIAEYEELLSENPIWRERTIGIGLITTEECLARSITGPILRSTGFAWDLRKAQPYLAYDEVEFDVVYGANGDVFDRYRLRLSEIYESIKIVRQCVERMPSGDYRTQDKKLTPPPRARIDESMEALIHHFKLFTEGFKVPAGETYVAIESPRGEIGCYLVSDGSGKPVRMHIRGPSFYNLQSIEPMGTGSLVADAVAIVSSVDPIMGEVPASRFTTGPTTTPRAPPRWSKSPDGWPPAKPRCPGGSFRRVHRRGKGAARQFAVRQGPDHSAGQDRGDGQLRHGRPSRRRSPDRLRQRHGQAISHPAERPERNVSFRFDPENRAVRVPAISFLSISATSRYCTFSPVCTPIIIAPATISTKSTSKGRNGSFRWRPT